MDLKDFGQKLKLIRLYYSLNREEMASSLNLKPTSYAKLEIGGVGTSMYVLKTLIDKYGININWLLSEEGEMLLPKGKVPNNVEQEYWKLLKENSELKSKLITFLEQPTEV